MFLPDSWEGLWLSLSRWRHIQGSPCWRRSCAPVQTPPPSSPHWELLTHPCSAGLGAGGDLHPVLPGQRALLAFDRKDWMKQRLGVHRAGQDPQRAGGNYSCVRSQARTRGWRARECVWKAVEYRQAPGLAVTHSACRGSPRASGSSWLCRHCHAPTGDRGPVLCCVPFSVCSELFQDVILQEQSTFPNSELQRKAAKGEFGSDSKE